jgi:threonine synthase
MLFFCFLLKIVKGKFVKYLSTRGNTPPLSFSDCILMGLAPDGGLILPETYPVIDKATLAKWRDLSYADLAFEILSLYATDIPAEDLKALTHKTYTAEVYGSADITPLKTLKEGIHLLALSNGPTLAFKDMAMQFLGNLFEYILAKKGQKLTILGATSGDTGSAAEYALRGKANIEVFMLSPAGKMSAFQRAQMYSLQDENIHNIAIEGFFDDCQDIVKAVQNDAIFKEKHRISTVNSINWARIVAQVVYYFKGYFNATLSNDEQVSFCVPSGNFGNVCAGHIARSMGLPIARLVVATNENDVLHDFFSLGQYQPRTSAQTQVTSSPSMDISKASNFERFAFDLTGRNPEVVRQLWGEVDQGRGFDLAHLKSLVQTQYGFVSGRSTHQDRLATIRSVASSDDLLIDPHTADGLKVAREQRQDKEIMICLETALPEKFAEMMTEALGYEPPKPDILQALERLPQRYVSFEADALTVKHYIEKSLKDI